MGILALCNTANSNANNTVKTTNQKDQFWREGIGENFEGFDYLGSWNKESYDMI